MDELISQELLDFIADIYTKHGLERPDVECLMAIARTGIKQAAISGGAAAIYDLASALAQMCMPPRPKDFLL